MCNTDNKLVTCKINKVSFEIFKPEAIPVKTDWEITVKWGQIKKVVTSMKDLEVLMIDVTGGFMDYLCGLTLSNKPLSHVAEHIELHFGGGNYKAWMDASKGTVDIYEVSFQLDEAMKTFQDWQFAKIQDGIRTDTI